MSEFMDRRLLVGLLGAVVIASGCTDPGGGGEGISFSTNSGLTIQEFSLTPSNSIQENQPVQLNFRVKNTGEGTIENGRIEIYNPPRASVEDRGTGQWGVPGRIFENGQIEQSFADNPIRPADPETGLQANPIPVIQATLTAPDLSQNVKRDYEWIAEVKYEYNSVGTTELLLVGREKRQEDNIQSSAINVDNSAGPIKVDVNARNPIVFYGSEDGTTAHTERFCINVKNAGSGTPYIDGIDEDGQDDKENRVNLAVESPSIDLERRDDGGDGSQTTAVRLIGETNQGTQCYDVDPSTTPELDRQMTAPITITTEYFYKREATETVSVQGREGTTTEPVTDGGGNPDNQGDDTQDDGGDSTENNGQFDYTGNDADYQMRQYGVDSENELCETWSSLNSDERPSAYAYCERE